MYFPISHTTNLTIEANVSKSLSCNLLTCWMLERIIDCGLGMYSPSYIQQWECDVYFPFSLGNLGIPFLVSQKVTNESFAFEFVLSFLLLNFPYLVLLFMTLIWTPFRYLKIPLAILRKPSKVFKITWILVFIIVLRASCQANLLSSSYTPCKWKKIS